MMGRGNEEGRGMSETNLLCNERRPHRENGFCTWSEKERAEDGKKTRRSKRVTLSIVLGMKSAETLKRISHFHCCFQTKNSYIYYLFYGGKPKKLFNE